MSKKRNKPTVCQGCDCWDSCRAVKTNPRHCEAETQYDFNIEDVDPQDIASGEFINQEAVDSAALPTWKRWFVAIWYPGSDTTNIPDFCAKDVDPERVEGEPNIPFITESGHTHVLYSEEYGANTGPRRLTVTERMNLHEDRKNDLWKQAQSLNRIGPDMLKAITRGATSEEFHKIANIMGRKPNNNNNNNNS